MKEVRPVIHKDAHTQAINNLLGGFFEETLWAPIAEKMEPDWTKYNDTSSPELIKRIQTGTIRYKDDKFTGEINSKVARELFDIGAKFDKRSKSFVLEKKKLPFAVNMAVFNAKANGEKTHKAVLAFLAIAVLSIDKASTGIEVKPALDYIAADLVKQSKGEFTPMPSLEADLEQIIKDNLDAGVKAIQADLIKSLREEIGQSLVDGGTIEDLKAIVLKKKVMAQRRAKMLAEHQAAVFIANYREGQYRAIGSRSYLWNTQRDKFVRHDHVLLDRRRFSWDDPPITNQATGDRNHPGGDYGCRCYPTALIP